MANIHKVSISNALYKLYINISTNKRSMSSMTTVKHDHITMAVYLNNIIIIIKGHIHESQYSIQGMNRLDNYFYIFMVRLARIYHKDKRSYRLFKT